MSTIDNVFNLIFPIYKDHVENYSQENRIQFESKIESLQDDLIQAGMDNTQTRNLINYYLEQDVPKSSNVTLSDIEQFVRSDIKWQLQWFQ